MIARAADITETLPLARVVPAWRSLRAKALLAFAVVMLYFVAAGTVLSLQREKMFVIVEELERINRVQSALARAHTFTSQAVLKLNEAYSGAHSPHVLESLSADVEAIIATLPGLAAWYSEAEATRARLDERLEHARRERGGAGLVQLRSALDLLTADLDRASRQVRERYEAVWAGYFTTYDSVTLTAALLFLLGVAVFGAIVMGFMRRLAWDIRVLSERAIEVVRGYRGSPLVLGRDDEVGALMDAVNRMQHILREREQQIEVARQQRFHHEKMAAIGSLAAAVAHEINNPIAAIEGVAQSIHQEAQARCGGRGPCHPELILEHTRRIVGITRQLSELAGPPSGEAEWTDLNALTRTTCTFVTYDPRFRDVRMELRLDSSIPAAWTVADHVTQTLMNLLINAADALRACGERERRIEVATAGEPGFVRFEVRDNADGMPEEVAARAFQEGFTTKAEGSGIGLFMCKTLVERGGGTIGLASRSGEGTLVTVRIPTHPPQAGGVE